MNYALLANQISQGLGDPSNAIFNALAVDRAIAAAINEYSRWRPIRRRLGTGNLWAGAASLASGTTTIMVVGGVFLQGGTVILDANTPLAETLTIEAASVYQWPGSGAQAPTTPLTQLTFTTPTTKAHNDGAFIINQQIGFNLVAGQDTYYLPADWIKVEQASFDLAAGIKLTPIKGNGFYDASYEIARNLSGVGWGGASNYGPTSYFGLPVVATPFDTQGRPIPNTCPYTVWNWQDSGIPLLTMQPAPDTNTTLDFFYYGIHTVATTPMADQEAVAAEARAWLLRDQAGSYSALADTEIKAGTLNISRTRDSLLKQAAEHHALFERRVIYAPYATSG